MKNLHVWLLISLFAAAACKPAVREHSTLQNEQEAERDGKIRKILIGAGVAGVAALAVALGVKRTNVFGKLKKAPKASAEVLERGTDDIGSFATISNKYMRSHLDETSAEEWEELFGLPYHSEAKNALADFLSVKRADAIEAVKNGKSIDEVLEDDSLRVMNRVDLDKRMKEIYPEDADQIKIEELIDEFSYMSVETLKELRKVVNALKEIADTTQ